MKLTTIFLIASMLQVSAATMAQQLTLKKSDVTLKQLFKEVRKQTGYSVVWESEKFNANERLSVDFNKSSLTEVFDRIILSKGYSYLIDETTVIIQNPKSIISTTGSLNNSKNIDVTGKIVDENGNAMPGVTVQVKDSRNGTFTDNRGIFKLANVDEKATILIYVLGYDRKEIPASTNIGIISLNQVTSKLDEVQIQAYGTTSRRLNTGSIVSIKAEDISKNPVTNPLLAISGQVPGLFITQGSGLPGANVTVRIQGQNSISRGNSPFYVVDGIPFQPLNAAGTGTFAVSNILDGGSPLAFIDPSSIESIEVLKDGDATAIYGSRAANGAILITTKKGKAGQTKVDANYQRGYGNISTKMKLLNTEQYIAMRKEAYFVNDKLTTSSNAYQTAYDINGTWDQNRYTDWQEELIGGTANINDASGSISGGSQTTQYRFGIGYHNETSVFPTDLGNQKTNLSFSLNHRSSNNKFQFQFTGNYQDDRNTLPQSDLTTLAMELPPNAPSLYTSDGQVNWAPSSTGTSTWIIHPLSSLITPYYVNTTNLIGNSIISYKILPGLEIKSSFGYNILANNENQKSPNTRWAPEFRPTAVRNTSYAQRSLTTMIVEPQLSYKNNLGPGSIDFLIGTTFQDSFNEGMRINASGFITDDQLDNISAATSVQAFNNKFKYRYNAIFGRINYNIKDRYILNVSARRDGSSRFGEENLFANFYSLGAAWIFSENALIKKLPWLSFGKLRASYGTTGSDQIDDFLFLNTLNSNQLSTPYQGVTGLTVTRHSNPYLQWEETNKINIGLDLGFLKDRLLLNTSYYRNTSSNQLVRSSLPIITGFGFIELNLPAKVRNTGLELLLESKNLVNQKLKWSTSFNLTLPKNTLIEFPGLESNTSYRNSLIIGQSLSLTKRYDFQGINPQTGLYQFKKANGNIVSNPSSATDRTTFVDLSPKFYAGLSNNFSFMGFQLDFRLQFVKRDGLLSQFGTNMPGTMYNQPQSVLDQWTANNPNGRIQKWSTNNFTAYNAAAVSNANYGDVSYLRLTNASISWNLPTNTLQKLKLQNLRFFVLGQNLFTITNFQSNPENLSFRSLAPLRILSTGIQISL